MIHIIPINDLKEHKETTVCKCQPKAIKENNELIIIHNSFDGREGIEWMEEILNYAE
jgi:hypothetical protein